MTPQEKIDQARRDRRVAILQAISAAVSVVVLVCIFASFFAQMQFIKATRDIIRIQDGEIAELRARVLDLERKGGQ